MRNMRQELWTLRAIRVGLVLTDPNRYEDTPCSGHGNCVKTNSARLVSVTRITGGASCSKRLCNGDDSCSNAASVLEGECLCPSPFYGDHCETRARTRLQLAGMSRGEARNAKASPVLLCGTKTCPDCGKFENAT